MVPAHCLYESTGQAQRWLAYARAWAPIHRGRNYQQLSRRAYDLAWQTIGNAPFDYVGYGCGDGLKDANFLARCLHRGQLETLRLMDISASLLIEAYQRFCSHLNPRPGWSIWLRCPMGSFNDQKRRSALFCCRVWACYPPWAIGIFCLF